MEFYAILSILAAGFVVFGIYVLFRARHVSRASQGAWYSVIQRDMGRKALWLNLQAAALLLVGAGLLVWLLIELPGAAVTDGDLAPAAPPETLEVPSAPTGQPPVEPSQVVTATISPALTPSAVDENETPLVAIPTVPLTSQAIITNTDGGGLWLRDAPFGNGLILLPEGSTVFVRGGLMEVDGILWQAVIEPEGREGWVAADFLIYR